MIHVEISKQLGDFRLEVAFDAPSGITALFGRSGVGKSTIAASVAGLLTPDAGRIEVAGEVLFDATSGINLPPHRRRIGTVFQDSRLFPHLTVAGNLAFGRRYAATPLSADEEARLIDLLGIGALMARRPAGLSGGERQRVALARALFSAPRLLVADEPLAALDGPRKAEIIPYFERLRDQMDLPVLYVSHDVSEVARLATTVVALTDGGVRMVGPTARVFADPDVLPMGARDAGAVFEARVAAHHADGLSELSAGSARFFVPQSAAPVGSLVRLRVAASDVMIATVAPTGLSALNQIAGRISAVTPGKGPGAIVTMDTAAGPLLARVTARSVAALGLAVGQEVYAVIKTVAIAKEDVANG